MPKAADDIRAAVKAAAGGKPDDAKVEAKSDEKPEVKPDAKSDEPEAAGMKKYKVKLQDNPEKVVEAGDRLDAIEAYKEACGIIATPHKFSVKLCKDE